MNDRTESTPPIHLVDCGCSSCATQGTFPPPRPLRAFTVEGMDCAEEVTALRREVGSAIGGEDLLSFDLMAGRMYVAAGVEAADDERVISAAARAGLRAVLVGDDVDQQHGWWARQARLVTTIGSAAAIVGGFALHALEGGGLWAALGLAGGEAHLPLPSVVLYLLGAATGLWFVAPRAWAAARAVRADMNLLMTVAILGAIGIGELLEAATVSFLYALSLLLESWSVGRARNAVKALLDLAPPQARVVGAGGEDRLVAPHEVAIGDTVIVHPGERVPLDGIVVAGRAHVDASPITGESRPAEAESGVEVFAGAIALDGVIRIRVNRHASDSVLARIVRRVAEAGRRRSRAERWVDSFARLYTPVVFAAAGLTALLPPLVGLGSWPQWFYSALVLLVIGCPCALVISTPVSVVAGLTAAARRGVLVKGGDLLELPARITVIAFDKTGTLTRSAPEVVAVEPLDGHGEDEVLALAASLESRNSHPIALAIVEAARARGATLRPAEEVRNIPGRGVTGVVDGTAAWLGSHRLLEERGQEHEGMHRALATLADGGRSVVVVGRDDHVCGFIALADTPRPEAAQMIDELRRLGVHEAVVLTGDNAETAEEVARAVGATACHAELLPDDKVEWIDRLRAAGPVAFVGDGINDAPALAAADLGIAMGAGGSDAAIETADVALMSDDLTRLPWLVRHSRRVGAVIRANVVFALAVKAVFVVATFAGFASLWAAIAADMGASLLVIANGLRLLSSGSD